MSATRENAIAYWSARLGGEAFTGETQARQEAALVSAADALAPYLTGLSDSDIEAATYEQALWLLGSRASAQAEGVQSFSVTGLSETYAVKGRPRSIAPAAWRIISYGVDGQGGRKKGPVWLL